MYIWAKRTSRDVVDGSEFPGCRGDDIVDFLLWLGSM